MQSLLNSPFNMGSIQFDNRLIQGPLAGFSCAPFRSLYYQFLPPAYCVSEMISAHDVLYKHQINSRYLYRAPRETTLCYQLSGTDPFIMAQAAQRLESVGANLIDINAGCPKAKIRKKGAGSALLDDVDRLCALVDAIRRAIAIPVTVKLRIHGDARDIHLAQSLEQAGADACIIHGRRWTDDYAVRADMLQIGRIKKSVKIPVIANGDMSDIKSLAQAWEISGCDAFMISRAGSGKPWLYQQLLAPNEQVITVTQELRLDCFMAHLQGLASLESEHKAVLQSKALVRYYFREWMTENQRQDFYGLRDLRGIERFLNQVLETPSSVDTKCLTGDKTILTDR